MKISVIIPIYKVEKYLRQCVDSVIAQTYSDLEVILVDDGSPDGCSQICNEYILRDERIKVIHKQNGGLSDARNKGIEIAAGDYGIFIDSDDYWDAADALERLVERIQVTKSDVLSFGFYKLYEDSGRISFFAATEASMPVELTNKKMQLEYLSNHSLISASACNKIVRLSILKSLPFEVGRLSEDIEWTAKLINQSNSFDFLNISFYCYSQRSGSITQTISEQSCKHLVQAIIGCCNVANGAEPDIRESLSQYAAYQFSTFFAVQSFASSFQRNLMQSLVPYKSILRHCGNNRKVKITYYGVRLFGIKNWCHMIRLTKPLWDKLRDKI